VFRLLEQKRCDAQ